MPISQKEKDEDKDENKKNRKTDENNNRSKIFVIIMILLVIGIATGAIVYTMTNMTTDPVASNITKLKPTTNNTTTEINISPKKGYSLIKLGGLNFFVTNDCAEKYKNGDYFDSYYGGKNYHTDYEHQAAWEKGPINNSQIVITNETNDTLKSFQLEISNIGDSSIADNLDYKNNATDQNISTEIIDLNGTNVTIIHTGENFISQTIGPNATIAIFKYDGKLIFMMWDAYPIDMYIIESFFKLN